MKFKNENEAKSHSIRMKDLRDILFSSGELVLTEKKYIDIDGLCKSYFKDKSYVFKVLNKRQKIYSFTFPLDQRYYNGRDQAIVILKGNAALTHYLKKTDYIREIYTDINISKILEQI